MAKVIKRWIPIYCIAFIIGYFLRISGNKFRGTDSYDYFVFYNEINGWEGLLNAHYIGDYLFSISTYAIWLTGVDGYWYLYILFIATVSTLLLSPSKLFNQKENSLFYIAALLLLCSSSLYLLSLNGLRQGMATAVAALGVYDYIINKRSVLNIRNLIYFVIAFYFHKSSIIVPIALLAHEIINRKVSPVLLIACGLIVGILLKNFLFFVANIIGLPEMADKLIGYDIQKSGGTSIILKVGFMVCFAIFFYYFSRTSNDYRLRLLVRIYIFLAAIQLLFIGYEIAINRLLLYTSILEPVIIVMLSLLFKRKAVYLYIISYLAVFYLYNILLWHPAFRGELGLQ